MNKVKVALLGGGVFAKTAHLPAILKTSTLELVALYSRSEKTVKALHDHAKTLVTTASSSSSTISDVGAINCYFGEDGLEELLARQDISTIVVCMPFTVQPDLIKAAWTAGKNVISEKPIAKDVATAKELVALWEETYKPQGIQWHIAEQYPYEPGYIKMCELIAGGTIGDLRSFSMDMLHFVPTDSPYYQGSTWRQDPDFQGGFILDGGVHFFAGLRLVLDAYKNTKVTGIKANSHQIQPHLPPMDTIQGCITTSTANLGGTFSISVAHEYFVGPSGLTIRGSKGMLNLSRGPDKMFVKLYQGFKEQVIAVVEIDGVGREFQCFAQALTEGPDSEAARRVDELSGPRVTLHDLQCVESAIVDSIKNQSTNV